MLTVGDKIYCYWKIENDTKWHLGYHTIKTINRESFVTDKNDVFFIDNDRNNTAKYITLKEYRKNKLKKICLQ